MISTHAQFQAMNKTAFQGSLVNYSTLIQSIFIKNYTAGYFKKIAPLTNEFEHNIEGILNTLFTHLLPVLLTKFLISVISKWQIILHQIVSEQSLVYDNSDFLTYTHYLFLKEYVEALFFLHLLFQINKRDQYSPKQSPGINGHEQVFLRKN